MDKTKKGNEKSKDDILNDPRFSHLVTDPRFKKLPHTERKVKIDKRFQSMFNDEKFKLKYTVDKYGRRVNNTTSEDLKKYYELDSDAEEEIEKEERRQEEIQIAKDSADSDDEDDIILENDQLGDDGEVLPIQIKDKLNNSDIDYARGEGRILSDSSSDDESSDDDSEIFIEHVWGELDADADTTEESTKRLAACNMDWDRIRASDILVLCTSFLPPGGSILSVKIYPSEFGKERLRDEEINGPQELVTKSDKNNDGKNSNNSDSDSDDDEDNLAKDENSDLEEGDDYHMEKLRQYQLNRLKYYYAVIECDSINTADKIYNECDGLEYESTATKLDLRFIPNSEIFDDNEIKDICTELPDLNKYKPRMFTTTALQQAKVELTWDETNVERRELSDKLSSGKLDDISDADLRKFVAYSSEEEDNEEEVNKTQSENEDDGEVVKTNDKEYISKYSNLLTEILEKEKTKKNNRYEMEYTWGINVNSKKSKEKSLEQKPKKDLTPIEKALEKKKEKNKKRKDERKKRAQERDGGKYEKNSDNDDTEIPDGIDLKDPYFAEEFANGDFEPINKNSKNKKSNKSKVNNDDDDEENSKELELLLDDGVDDKNHFSLEKIMKTENETKSNKKRKHKLNKSKNKNIEKKNFEEDNFKIDTRDERFNAIYKSHLYNIDPSDSNFKKTKGMEEIIKEKLKRKNEIDPKTNEEITENKRSKNEIENHILVNKLKKIIRGQNN